MKKHLPKEKFEKLNKFKILLKNFIKTKSIINTISVDFIKFAKTTNTDLTEDELSSFYLREKIRVRNRNSEYEKVRVRKTISFKLDEYNILLEKMEMIGTTDFSNFAKNVLLEKKIIQKIEKSLILEVNKIGNNLNQIAKAINKNEKINVLTQLVEIEKLLKSLGK